MLVPLGSTQQRCFGESEVANPEALKAQLHDRGLGEVLVAVDDLMITELLTSSFVS